MIMELLPVSPTAKAPASNFTGDVYVNPIYRGEEPSRMIVSLVGSLRARAPTGTPTRWARPCTSPTASGSSPLGTAR
jgi:hypothetical protein